MNKHNCYIAIYESFGDEYNNTEIITEKQFVEENLNLYSIDGGGYCRCRFNYCPICGAVIDWDELKRRQRIENHGIKSIKTADEVIAEQRIDLLLNPPKSPIDEFVDMLIAEGKKSRREYEEFLRSLYGDLFRKK